MSTATFVLEQADKSRQETDIGRMALFSPFIYCSQLGLSIWGACTGGV